MLVVVATRLINGRQQDGIGGAMQAELGPRQGITDRGGRQLRRQEENESIVNDESETDRDGELWSPKTARSEAHSC
jgi:hypothetical protein